MDDLQKRYAEWKARVSDPNNKRRNVTHDMHIHHATHGDILREKYKDPVTKEKLLQKLRAHESIKKYQGKAFKEWADELGVDTGTIHYHLNAHGHLDNVVPMADKLTDYQGKTYAEWARNKGVDRTTIVEHLEKYGHLNNVKKRKEKLWNGKSYMEWASIFGFKPNCAEPVYRHMKKHGHLENLRQYQDWAKQNNVPLVHEPYNLCCFT